MQNKQMMMRPVSRLLDIALHFNNAAGFIVYSKEPSEKSSLNDDEYRNTQTFSLHKYDYTRWIWSSLDYRLYVLAASAEDESTALLIQD